MRKYFSLFLTVKVGLFCGTIPSLVQFELFLYCIGVRAGGARGAAAPPKSGQLRFFGQQEKFGQSQFLKKFPCFFFEEIDIFYFNLKSAW